MSAESSPTLPCGHSAVHQSGDGLRCVRCECEPAPSTPTFTVPCQPTSLGRVAIEYGVYVLTGTVTEIHGGEWVMVLVDPVCKGKEGTPITGNPYPVPSVCGRFVPFGMSDVTPLLDVTLRKV